MSFVNSLGALTLAESEDRQMDGFAEGRGCYVLSAARKPRLEMCFDAGTLTRYCPVFEIRHWRHELPKFITVDGYRKHISVHYNARLDKGKLVMQYLGVLGPGVHTLRVGEPPRFR